MQIKFLNAVRIICCLIVPLGAPLAQAQLDTQTLNNLVSRVKAATTADQRVAAVDQPPDYASIFVVAPTKEQVTQTLMHTTQAQRLDIQTGSTAVSASSTSSTTTASVPWLFALAVEHGALTESTSGNLITLKGNVANFVKALKANTYLKSYAVGQNNALVQAISRASFSVSFNSSSGNASVGPTSNTLASASAHVDLYNHRDPRDKIWKNDWDTLTQDILTQLATRQGEFDHFLLASHGNDLGAWKSRTQQKISALYSNNPSPTDAQLEAAIQAIAQDFGDTFGKFTDVRDEANAVTRSLSQYKSKKGDVIYKINHSPIVSIEYTYTNQSTQSLPQSSTQTFSVGATPPSLSNINLIFEANPFKNSLLKNSQLTANASTNLFNSKPAGTNIGTVRDYRFSGQWDVPLPSIPSVGTSSLSFSGLFLSLLEQPLGQQVIVNTVPVSTKGNIGLFQAKWTIPVQNSGVQIPISFTASNRTELIKERDVRGTIGISFNFDSLFSKR